LGIILLLNIIEKLINSIIEIFINSKKDLLKNTIQLELFKKMEFMEIGRTMNSRFKHISDIIRTEFDSLSETIINGPKNLFDIIIKLF